MHSLRVLIHEHPFVDKMEIEEKITCINSTDINKRQAFGDGTIHAERGQKTIVRRPWQTRRLGERRFADQARRVRAEERFQGNEHNVYHQSDTCLDHDSSDDAQVSELVLRHTSV